MEKLSDRLKKIQAKIDTPEKWTKGTRAKTSDGREVDIDDPRASCFCIIGAMENAFIGYPLGANRHDVWRATVMGLRRDSGVFDTKRFTSLVDFNDHEDTTHADVMVLFDAAIGNALAKGN